MIVIYIHPSELKFKCISDIDYRPSLTPTRQNGATIIGCNGSLSTGRVSLIPARLHHTTLISCNSDLSAGPVNRIPIRHYHAALISSNSDLSAGLVSLIPAKHHYATLIAVIVTCLLVLSALFRSDIPTPPSSASCNYDLSAVPVSRPANSF